MKSTSKQIFQIKLQISRLQERLEALERKKAHSNSREGAIQTEPRKFDRIIEFDGGTSCNNPKQGYGKGYGSYQIAELNIVRVEFGMGHSCNSAEILTMNAALNGLIETVGKDVAKNMTILVRGDSRIALKWVHQRGDPSFKTSPMFQDAIAALKKIVPHFKKIETQWRGRHKSVELFGH